MFAVLYTMTVLKSCRQEGKRFRDARIHCFLDARMPKCLVALLYELGLIG